MFNGPGLSLRRRFAARPSTVLRPDPTLASTSAFPTRGYSSRLLDEGSSPDAEGFSSCHLLLITMSPLIPRRKGQPHETHCDRLLLLSHVCRPSQPPDSRVRRLHLRSLRVTTWRVAHTPFRSRYRRASSSRFRSTTPSKLRGLSLLAVAGLAPVG